MKKVFIWIVTMIHKESCLMQSGKLLTQTVLDIIILRKVCSLSNIASKYGAIDYRQLKVLEMLLMIFWCQVISRTSIKPSENNIESKQGKQRLLI